MICAFCICFRNKNLNSITGCVTFYSSLFYFKFGQTRSETKTLQIVRESFCVNSPGHAFFYFSLACPPFPPCNLPLFTVKSTLSSSCSHFDPFLSHQCGALAHLNSLPPHAAPASLPTALSVALRPFFSF